MSDCKIPVSLRCFDYPKHGAELKTNADHLRVPQSIARVGMQLEGLRQSYTVERRARYEFPCAKLAIRVYRQSHQARRGWYEFETVRGASDARKLNGREKGGRKDGEEQHREGARAGRGIDGIMRKEPTKRNCIQWKSVSVMSGDGRCF